MRGNKPWLAPSELSQVRLLPRQIRLPAMWLARISMASVSASLLKNITTVLPTVSRARPIQQDWTLLIRTSPPTEPSSYALKTGRPTAAKNPCGVQLRPPPPPVWITSPPRLKLCTMTPRARLDRRSRPTVRWLDSVGWFWFGSSRQAKLDVLQPSTATAPARTRTLPCTLRLELCIPNAATRTEPGLTVTLPETTAGPLLTKHTPFTTTLDVTVPVSTPGAFGLPEQVVVPVTAAPAAVTGTVASTPPMTAPVNTRTDKLRRYPLMTQFLPFSRRVPPR